ncbi:hypothetical protein [Enterovirga aerilata]|uniref:Uncharacterized protein n=1 Tax=Enterovirga aerilata TaxID=2730920 RepID=A0A849HUI0_9HYPH|nr:hypothetical protein [Enterovirga sp. DB1703]NNM71156.1 hypothetical protein [Enterovirga sp. DB1703]
MSEAKDGGEAYGREEHEKALSRQVREHLGRKLRSELRVEAEKPAFLGDEAVPPQFAGLVHQLQRREMSSQQGLDALRKEFGLPERDEGGGG